MSKCLLSNPKRIFYALTIISGYLPNETPFTFCPMVVWMPGVPSDKKNTAMAVNLSIIQMKIDFTIDTIQDAARAAWDKYCGKKIWVFDAPMGAGKTTFIKTLCEDILLCQDIPSSPTFSIINEYKSAIAGKVFHMDWYRLKDEEEAIQSGVEDALHHGDLCLVEWPERAPLLLPADVLYIKIEVLDENTRRIVSIGNR